MRRLIVCCDGSWESEFFQDDSRMSTNIARLYNALDLSDSRKESRIEQLKLYIEGVGTGEELLVGLVEGASGLGVLKKVREVYYWLCGNYELGDEIFLFGFSRGAYIARLVASLICLLGILEPKSTLDLFPRIFLLLCDKRDPTTSIGRKRQEELAGFIERMQEARTKQLKASDGGFLVRTLGLFETVPPYHLFSRPSVGAHDPGNPFSLSDHLIEPEIKTVLHALAINEDRPSYMPIIFKPGSTKREQGLCQAWFSGAHKDVGGGYVERDLSNVSLAWLVSQVEQDLSVDLEWIRSLFKNSSAPWGAMEPHRGAGRFLHHRQRTFNLHSPFENVHSSVLEQPARFLPEIVGHLLRDSSISVLPLSPFEAQVKKDWHLRYSTLSPSSSISLRPFSPERRQSSKSIAYTAQRHKGRCPLHFILEAEHGLVDDARSTARAAREMTEGRRSTWWEDNKAAGPELFAFVRKNNWKETTRNSFGLKYLPWWILCFVTVAVGVLLGFYRDTIVETIQPQRKAIIHFPFSWVVPLLATILISATPFTGRHIVLILAGLIYELKVALLISAVGVFFGEILCYVVFKSLFAKRAAKIEQKNLFYGAVALSQRRSGIIFLSVVRYSFIPSRVASATQAIVGVSFFKFMAAAVISMPKQLSEVWIGALIAGTPDPAKRNQHMTITIVILVITGVTGTIALYEVYMRARRYYPQLRAERFENQMDARTTNSDLESEGNVSDKTTRAKSIKGGRYANETDEVEKDRETSAFIPVAR
ncbi:uncharacterized protein JCM6883_001066 [Sporobolomyces salmoneus]|uniref:uncharacterized protein n=1 Tax=Sporobolomyces salmoneus TaxID=183962 RepID=UPI00316BE8DC